MLLWCVHLIIGLANYRRRRLAATSTQQHNVTSFINFDPHTFSSSTTSPRNSHHRSRCPMNQANRCRELLRAHLHGAAEDFQRKRPRRWPFISLCHVFTFHWINTRCTLQLVFKSFHRYTLLLPCTNAHCSPIASNHFQVCEITKVPYPPTQKQTEAKKKTNNNPETPKKTHSPHSTKHMFLPAN